jgi:zinc transport system ATP-binding protein
MAQLTCKNLSISYGNNLALKDVSFEINSGDYVCIVGSNGSGKSTLLKGILGLIPRKAGEIFFDKTVKAGQIGYLAQQTNIQRDFPASVYEVVISGCLTKRGIKPFYSRKEKDTALNNLKRLEIEQLMHKSYKNLSGGQQQRVLLARALCSTEKILFMDEPINGLDPKVAQDFYALVKGLNEEDGLTVVMTSHDIGEAMKYANKMLHLDTSVVFYGKIEDYLSSDISKRLFGGHSHGKH